MNIWSKAAITTTLGSCYDCIFSNIVMTIKSGTYNVMLVNHDMVCLPLNVAFSAVIIQVTGTNCAIHHIQFQLMGPFWLQCHIHVDRQSLCLATTTTILTTNGTWLNESIFMLNVRIDGVLTAIYLSGIGLIVGCPPPPHWIRPWCPCPWLKHWVYHPQPCQHPMVWHVHLPCTHHDDPWARRIPCDSPVPTTWIPPCTSATLPPPSQQLSSGWFTVSVVTSSITFFMILISELLGYLFKQWHHDWCCHTTHLKWAHEYQFCELFPSNTLPAHY